MKPTLTLLTALLLAPLAAQTNAPAEPDPNFIASSVALKARIAKQLHITKPDFIVFVPEVSGGASDTGNEHFLVFDGPDGSLMAVWTQSSVENFSPNTPQDQHIVFSQSKDEGKTWSQPRILAGPKKAGDGHMASWAYPLVSKQGRIYVLYSQSIGKHDSFVHHTAWLHGIYSDDNGVTWSQPQNVPVARSIHDNPDPTMPPNMLVWQKPLRLGKDGKYLAGFTRWTSFAVREPSPKSLGTADSRVEFMRFENVDENPEPCDLKISWFMSNEKALAVPCPAYPENSVCQEPSIVKLPDGRLFCVMRTAAGSPFWSVSGDLGETWTEPRRLLHQDGGEPLLHPVSPCPIYDVGGNEAGSGRYVLFIHDNDGNFQGYRPNPPVTGFNRRPVYLVPGHFQPGADQPVWFGDLKFFMDHDNVSLGKIGTNGRFDLSLYSSFTVRNGQPVLWYPDRKFFLLGRIIGSECFAPSSHAAANHNSRALSTSEQATERAFGCTQIKLGGVMGHRIETMIEGNLLKLDMERDFLSFFRKKREKTGYRGLGKTLDAAVHLAAYSPSPDLIAWKNHWIDELISTQEENGYIGIFPPGPLRAVAAYDTHEKGPIILALVNDYRFFGRKKSLQAAKKLADEIIATWSDAVPINFLYTNENPMILLSEVSGDRKYVDWVRDTFFPEGKLAPAWSMRLGGNPLSSLNMEGCHTYRWCDVNIAMLSLNRFYPDPVLVAAWPQMIAWLKDGGALPPGSFAEGERWRRSWTTQSGVAPNPELLFKNSEHRTKIGESCAKCYVLELLDRLMEIAPDAYFGDVMERAYYNGVFASQSPDGRRLAYDLSVEGTRIPNPIDHYCCPGNLRRAFAYLPGRIYRRLADGLYVNLYTASEATLMLPGGTRLRLKQVTDYPVSGKIRLEVEPESPVQTVLALRVPAWCGAPAVRVNSKPVSDVEPGTFLRLDREWRKGDVVELNFPMEWRWVKGIREQEGRVCLLRGPVVYTLNPFKSGLEWYQDMDAGQMGISRVTNPSVEIPNYKQHLESMQRLAEATMDPSTLSTLEPDKNVHPSGQQTTIKGWLGKPAGSPTHTFVLTEFVDPQGRKIFFRMSAPSVAVDDELFGKEIHESTVYSGRWQAVKKGLDTADLAQVPVAGLEQALLVAPMRGSYEAETAKGELAGRPAWMSCSLAQTGKRRMEFRVYNENFQNGACPNVTLSVLYLDKGDCKVSLIYDSGDDVVRVPGRAPGAFKPGGEFKIGNTGTIKRHDFKLPDARFGKNLLLEGTDFRLVADKDADFLILGAFLQPLKTK